MWTSVIGPVLECRGARVAGRVLCSVARRHSSESAPTSPGVLPQTQGANNSGDADAQGDSSDRSGGAPAGGASTVDTAKNSLPLLSTSLPEDEGAWQEVRRRQREKSDKSKKTPTQVRY